MCVMTAPLVSLQQLRNHPGVNLASLDIINQKVVAIHAKNVTKTSILLRKANLFARHVLLESLQKVVAS
jgi:hypothetical protein